MTIHTSSEIEMPRLVQAIFCEDCVQVDLTKSAILCRHDECACAQEVPLQTILDLYANLYYFANSMNLDVFITRSEENEEDCHRIRRDIFRKWTKHTSVYPYDRLDELELDTSTNQLIRHDLEASATAEDLAVRLVSWVIVIDKSLERLKKKKEGDEEWLSIRTFRGVLLPKRSTRLNGYIRDQFDAKQKHPVRDANYVRMDRFVQHFHLAKLMYPRYTVHHQILPSGEWLQEGNVADIKIGFFPGLLSSEEYDWRNGALTEQGLQFRFGGIVKPEFSNEVDLTFDAILEYKPDFVIMPELFTPLPIQRRLAQRLPADHIQRALDGDRPLAMMMPGSFHATSEEIYPHISGHPDRVYNYSQVVLGDGEKFLDIFKMNMFKIPPNDKYEGKMKPYKNQEGVEHIAFDRRDITLLETPLGRIAVFICIDFITESIDEVLRDRYVDLVFVMAYTGNPAGGKFEREMHGLGERTGATVIICNNYGSWEDGDRMVAYFPGVREPFRSDRHSAVFSVGEMLNHCLR